MAPIAGITVVGLPGFLAGLDGFAPQFAAAQKVAMEAATHLVEADAKHRVPHRTGTLRASIKAEVMGFGPSLNGTVGTELKYGPFVEEGTASHDISPTSALALMVPVASARAIAGGASVFGGGRLSGAPRAGQQVAFFASVHHPGTKAHAYLVPALDDNRLPIERLFQRAAQRALDQIAASTKATLGLFGKLTGL